MKQNKLEGQTLADSLAFLLAGKMLKQIYMRPAPDTASPIAPAYSTQVVLGLVALGVLLLGCLPNLLVGRLRAVISVSGS